MRVLLLALGKTPLKFDQNPYFFENLTDGDNNRDIDIITFGYNDGVGIRINPEDDFKKVVDRLPDGWVPDCCILQAIDNNLLPRGIEGAPFPVVVIPLPGDWDLDLPYTKAIVEAADVVVGAGYFDEENYPVLGASNVEIFYIGSVMGKDFDPQPKIIRDRTVDIFYTASWLNNLSRPERSQWAAKLALLSQKHNVLIETWTRSYEEYLSLLRNSKLAFSHVRQEVFSNRVFEAASQGTVPVVTGRDARRYFEDGSEIISVTDDDFFEKVEYYLKNDALLQEMSDRVYKKGKRDFESKSRNLKLLEIIERKYKGKKTVRGVDSLCLTERHIRTGEIYFYAYCRGAVEGFGYWFADKNTSAFLGSSVEEFTKAVNTNPSPRAKTNLAVAESALMFEQNNNGVNDKDIRKIVSLLRDVTSNAPEYVMAYFNLGILYFRLNRHGDALNAFTEATRLLEDDTAEFDPWCLQNRDYGLYKLLLKKPLNGNLPRLMRKETSALNNLKDLIQFATWYFISQIHEERGDLYTCLDSLRKAYNLYPVHPLIVKKIAQLSGILGYREECLEMYGKAAEIMPLDMDLRMERISYLYLDGNDTEMLNEISELKEMITGIKTLSDKICDLKTFMNSLGRYIDRGFWFDPCKEAMLHNMAHVLYSCLGKNPEDIRLVIRIAEIWHDFGRFDKILELVENYLNHIKKPDNDTVSLLAGIYKYLEGSVEARKIYFAGQIAALPAAKQEVSI